MSGQGWNELTAAIAEARELMNAAAPDAVTAREGEDALLRLVSASLADASLGHLLSGNGLRRPLPTLGGPNPDYLMCHAGIDPAGRYRLEGSLNDSERAGVGLYTVGERGEMLLAGYHVFDGGNVAADGGFSLTLSAEATPPDGLAMPAGCRVMMVRVLHRSDGLPCTLRLQGGSGEPALPPPGSAEDSARQAARRVLATVRQFLEWSHVISAHPNGFIEPPPTIAEAARGDPDTYYCFGYFDLAEDELLEVSIPEGERFYWSLHAYNHWLELLPGVGVHDRNAQPDADGRVRVRLGPAPAQRLRNGVDTQGRQRGVLIYRTLGETQGQLPMAARVVREAQ